MRSSIVLLAALAGSALALPADGAVDRRNFPVGVGVDIGASVDIGGIINAVLGADVHVSAKLLAGISAHAAAALQGGALGCKATVIADNARLELEKWLNLETQTHITGDLKLSLLAWCKSKTDLVLHADVLAGLALYIPVCADIAAKNEIYVTIDGIHESSVLKGALILDVGLQAKLKAFLHAAAHLSVNIKAGLHACAAGGLVTGVSADVKAELLAWVKGAKCTLSAELKAAVLVWLDVKAEVNVGLDAGLALVGSVSESALTAVSVGASVGVSVSEHGALSISGQNSLKAFLEAKLGLGLAAHIKTALGVCARGELAASLDIKIRTALAIWLSGSDCTLGAELKALVLLWLSVAADAEVSVQLVSGALVDISGFVSKTAAASLSLNVRVALGLLAAGESLVALSWEARAELAAFLGGCTSIDIGVSIEIIISQWFCGCKIPGGPAHSSVPSLPSSTQVVSISASHSVTGPAATATVPATVPAGSETTGPAPSVPKPTGGVPAGTVPSGPAPSGPAGGAPSGPAGPAPSGPAGGAPSGPAGTVPAGSNPPTETGSHGDSGDNTSAPSAPATTAPPSGGVPAVITTTVTQIHTVCSCA